MEKGSAFGLKAKILLICFIHSSTNSFTKYLFGGIYLMVIWAPLPGLLWGFLFFILHWPVFTAWLVQTTRVCEVGRVKEVSPCEPTSPLQREGHHPLRATFPSPWVVSVSQHTEQQVRTPDSPAKAGCLPDGLFPFWLLGTFRRGGKGIYGEHSPHTYSGLLKLSSGPLPLSQVSTPSFHEGLCLGPK